jgi:hypothetical protein
MIYTGFASRQTDDVDEQTTQYKARTNEATSHVELTNRLTRRLFGSHIVARGCNFLTMAGFNGKWRLVGGENVEAYQTAISEYNVIQHFDFST